MVFINPFSSKFLNRKNSEAKCLHGRVVSLARFGRCAVMLRNERFGSLYVGGNVGKHSFEVGEW